MHVELSHGQHAARPGLMLRGWRQDDISVEWGYFELCGLAPPTKSCAGAPIPALDGQAGVGSKGSKQSVLIIVAVVGGVLVLAAVVMIALRQRKAASYQLMLTPDEEAMVMDSDDDDLEL